MKSSKKSQQKCTICSKHLNHADSEQKLCFKCEQQMMVESSYSATERQYRNCWLPSDGPKPIEAGPGFEE